MPRALDEDSKSDADFSGAEALRQCGNTFYRAAIKCYANAALQEPRDPSPYANLSAAHYEIGHYARCIEDINQAVKLYGDDAAPSKHKLAPRLVKSYMQLKNYEAAEKALEQMRDHAEWAILSAACQKGSVSRSLDEAHCRRRILHSLPRYLPTLSQGTEYYVVGHDDACSQIDESMFKQSNTTLAVFFGGIGDARNLFATMLGIDRLEKGMSGEKTRTYHATINDIKTSVLARDLLMFHLLDDLAAAVGPSSGEIRTELLATIFFLYVGALMPKYIFDRIQDTIGRVIAMFRSGDGNLDWLHVYERDTPQLIASLNSWRGKLKSMYSAAEVTRSLVQFYEDSNKGHLERAGGPKQRKGCKREIHYFKTTGAHWPPETLRQRREPELPSLRDEDATPKKMKLYVLSNWKVNVTMLDVDWQRASHGSLDSAMGFDPYDMMESLYKKTGIEEPKKKSTLYDYVSHFFSHVADVIRRLKGRILVEVIHGEITGVMDKIRHGELERNRGFPSSYDQVHMSNIPDYIGGPLTSFLFATPITKPFTTSAITANCLRNTPIWDTLSQFYNEYLLVSGKEEILQLMQVEREITDREKANEIAFQKIEDTLRKLPAPLRKLPAHILKKLDFDETFRRNGLEAVLDLSQEDLRNLDLKSMCTLELDTLDLDGGPTINPLGEYFKWRRTSTSPLDFSALLPRPALQKWLFALFFKIVLPVDRTSQPWDTLIYCPLNLTVFFRTLIHLHTTGYPSHWLSEVLVQLIENRVTTSARPPQTSPLDIKEAQRLDPMKKLSTAPFVTEIQTLSTIFHPILPFPLITDALPAPPNISSYTTPINPLPHGAANVPTNTLLFFHQKRTKAALGENFLLKTPPLLRRALHPEFEGRSVDDDDGYRALQREGLKLLTTFAWDAEKGEATFWMESDVMDEMQKGKEWHVAMWRTDTWDSVSWPRPVGMEGVVRKGEGWFG